MSKPLDYERPQPRPWSKWWVAVIVVILFLVLAATVLVA
jgi:hypothetical protein